MSHCNSRGLRPLCAKRSLSELNEGTWTYWLTCFLVIASLSSHKKLFQCTNKPSEAHGPPHLVEILPATWAVIHITVAVMLCLGRPSGRTALLVSHDAHKVFLSTPISALLQVPQLLLKKIAVAPRLLRNRAPPARLSLCRHMPATSRTAPCPAPCPHPLRSSQKER